MIPANEPAIVADTPAASGHFMLRGIISLLFLCGIWFFTQRLTQGLDGGLFLMIAALAGGYMAMNIGANDVANNVGPAVGSRAITLGKAVAIAAIFEAAGSLIAGGDVVGTIQKGIIDPSGVAETRIFIWLMMAALLAGALWLNVATWMGAPVSTTHSIVGGVLGAGIAAGGWHIANWGALSAIVASWVVSPVLGGIFAACFLFVIKHLVMYADDTIKAARKVVPWIIALMAWAFVTYLMMKGFKKIYPVGFLTANLIGIGGAVLAYFLTGAWIGRQMDSVASHPDGVGNLFTWPLIFAAALLSFAHGANDVANAVGPLAAIHSVLMSGGEIGAKSALPHWILLIGAVGIVFGLALFGTRVMMTVGKKITELTPSRGFAAELAAASTVVLASGIGVPISTTHTLVGAVLGVGMARGISALNLRVISTIFTSWVVTLPAGALLSILFFYFFKGLFGS